MTKLKIYKIFRINKILFFKKLFYLFTYIKYSGNEYLDTNIILHFIIMKQYIIFEIVMNT